MEEKRGENINGIGNECKISEIDNAINKRLKGFKKKKSTLNIKALDKHIDSRKEK